MDNNIIQTEYSDLMKKSYIDYAMSVIVGRALPDVVEEERGKRPGSGYHGAKCSYSGACVWFQFSGSAQTPPDDAGRHGRRRFSVPSISDGFELFEYQGER